MQRQSEPFARTLKDIAGEYQWIRMMGWSDDELGRVQVHGEPDPADEMIDLTNFGGTKLPVSEADIATSADLHDAVPNLYVYRNSTPPELWNRLRDLANSGGPAGRNPAQAFSDATPVDRAEADKPQREEVGQSGVYPASAPHPPLEHAEVRTMGEWGQGDRGAAGYEDHGSSEVRPIPPEGTSDR